MINFCRNIVFLYPQMPVTVDRRQNLKNNVRMSGI